MSSMFDEFFGPRPSPGAASRNKMPDKAPIWEAKEIDVSMGNALRFSKKLKHTGRESYYYNAFVNDVIISTIRLDSKGWWYSWHNTMLSYSEEDKQGVRDFVSQLNKKGGFEDRHA